MIVCICNRLNEADIYDAFIEDNASHSEDVFRFHQTAKLCGSCETCMNSTLQNFKSKIKAAE